MPASVMMMLRTAASLGLRMKIRESIVTLLRQSARVRLHEAYESRP